MPSETLILSRQDVQCLLTTDECIAAVEGVFRLYGKGEAPAPGILGIHARHGGFHMKAGTLQLGDKSYFVAKTNANFPNNKSLHALPTIQGVIILSDGDNGRMLALMDSIEITILRTGAATAVAAKYLARPNSKTLTIVGAGNQGAISLRMLATLFPLESVFVYDIDAKAARQFSETLSKELSISITTVSDLHEVIRQTDICVTCTTSRQPILKKGDLPPGIFVAAVGADSPDKQELDSELLANAKLVTDLTDQCEKIGELHHAIEKKLITRKEVYAELGDVVSGKKRGRESDDEIIIFDSTGMALQDVASAVIVYEQAMKRKAGLVVNLN